MLQKKLYGGLPYQEGGRRTKGKFRCFMWRMTMMPLYQSGFGNVYSLKSNAGKVPEEHGTNSYSHRPESNPFASKIICGDCNKVFARKGWRSSTGVDRKVWQCSERYKVK